MKLKIIRNSFLFFIVLMVSTLTHAVAFVVPGLDAPPMSHERKSHAVNMTSFNGFGKNSCIQNITHKKCPRQKPNHSSNGADEACQKLYDQCIEGCNNAIPTRLSGASTSAKAKMCRTVCRGNYNACMGWGN